VSMIERVARFHWEARRSGLTQWDDLSDDHRAKEITATRAALGAMRDASVPMAVAGYTIYDPLHLGEMLKTAEDDADGRVIARASFPGRIWSAMINAALAQGTEARRAET